MKKKRKTITALSIELIYTYAYLSTCEFCTCHGKIKNNTEKQRIQERNKRKTGRERDNWSRQINTTCADKKPQYIYLLIC